jgi:hypothetical protein
MTGTGYLYGARWQSEKFGQGQLILREQTFAGIREAAENDPMQTFR